MSLINARLIDTNLSSYESFYSDQSRSENLTASEFKTLQHLSKNKNILIHKVDKGNTIVILDKISYISAIEEILNDHTKFSDLDIPAGKEINYITNLQKTITSDLKLLKDEEIIDKATYKTIKLVGSRPAVLYRLRKVHKETNVGLPPFHPILSAIGMPTYTLAKLLLPLLMPLTQNEYRVTDPFHFAEEICKQDPIYTWLVYMLIPYLLTYHWVKPLIFALIVCTRMMRIPLRSKRMFFHNLLTTATKESFFYV